MILMSCDVMIIWKPDRSESQKFKIKRARIAIHLLYIDTNSPFPLLFVLLLSNLDYCSKSKPIYQRSKIIHLENNRKHYFMMITAMSSHRVSSQFTHLRLEFVMLNCCAWSHDALPFIADSIDRIIIIMKKLINSWK